MYKHDSLETTKDVRFGTLARRRTHTHNTSHLTALSLMQDDRELNTLSYTVVLSQKKKEKKEKEREERKLEREKVLKET